MYEGKQRGLKPTLLAARHSVAHRGLAPLELVISLPILMMMMAAIVVFATAACWTLRAEVVARDEIWQHRQNRREHDFPRPDGWPQAGTSGIRADAAIPLDNGMLRQPVVSGPLGGGIGVNGGLLEFSRSVDIGWSHITRNPPMMRSLGAYERNAQNLLMHDRFQYRQMGLGSNGQRRMPLIYSLPSPPAETNAYQQAVQAIVTASFYPKLGVLDRDADFARFRGRSPDFHPGIGFCSLDADQVKQQQVPRLNQRINNLPRSMTQAFINMYRSVLAETDPAPTAAVKTELEAKIKVLQDYLATLP